MKTIRLSTSFNCAYIKIDNNGSHSVHKHMPRQGGELFYGFKPQIGHTESLERALKYCGANKKEIANAMAEFR